MDAADARGRTDERSPLLRETASDEAMKGARAGRDGFNKPGPGLFVLGAVAVCGVFALASGKRPPASTRPPSGSERSEGAVAVRGARPDSRGMVFFSHAGRANLVSPRSPPPCRRTRVAVRRERARQARDVGRRVRGFGGRGGCCGGERALVPHQCLGRLDPRDEHLGGRLRV